MKSFSDLPRVDFDPAVALSIEDGLPANVDLGDYSGPRRLSKVLELAAPASGVVELANAAKCLQAECVHVIRLSDDATGSRLLNAATHECLAESGDCIAAIDLDDSLVAADAGADPIVARLIALSALDAAESLGPPWIRLTAHEVMARAAGVTLACPDAFNPSGTELAVDPEWWGLPYEASTDDAEAFAAHVAKTVSRIEFLRWTLTCTEQWLCDGAASVCSLAQLLKEFDADRPYARGLGFAA